MTEAPLLEVRNMEVRYGEALAVARVGLRVERGAWVAIVGPNGAGKTSLARAICGLIPHGGTTMIDGEDVSALPAWERRRRGLGYSPEGRQLFGQMTVEENLRVGAFTRSNAEVRDGFEQVFALFPRLAERRTQAAATLSGGEQQMLALGRALMDRPKVLLVDEISWGLMPILVTLVFERLAALNREGLTILQIEQNAHEVLRHASYAYVMAAANCVLEGPAASVASDPRVLESYFG